MVMEIRHGDDGDGEDRDGMDVVTVMETMGVEMTEMGKILLGDEPPLRRPTVHLQRGR